MKLIHWVVLILLEKLCERQKTERVDATESQV